MDPNKLRPSRPRTLDSVGGSAARPAGKPAGSSHVIDLRQKSSSFAAPTAPQTPQPPARPRPPERPQAQARVSAPPPERSKPPVAASPAAPVVKPKASAEHYTDAAFPVKTRFWPAFWRFLFLLIVLGLIIALGVYIYFSYYQG